MAQTLPRVLSLTQAGAVSVACDFCKAYDIVDRDFLFKVMEVMGCGAHFRRIVRTLLTDTRARVEINGELSSPANFEAGVRQGCPLAPLFYLFVNHPMSCFLAANGVGILVAGTRLAGPLRPPHTLFPPSCTRLSSPVRQSWLSIKKLTGKWPLWLMPSGAQRMGSAGCRRPISLGARSGVVLGYCPSASILWPGTLCGQFGWP